jgi:hypothetical protein
MIGMNVSVTHSPGRGAADASRATRSRRRRHTAVSATYSARSLHFADPQMPFVPRKNIGYDDPGKRANEAANALTRANEEPSAARGNYGSGAWE